MELHSCRSSQLETVPPDEHTYEDGISAVDLDSLSIAQGIGMSGPTFLPQTSAPPKNANVSLHGICNLISDDEERDPEMRRQESAPVTRVTPYNEASLCRRSTERLSAEEKHQSRVMECLQPLLNAIDIVSMQNDDGDSVPTSSAHQKPDDDEEKETEASRSSPSASTLEQSGPAMRSLNDMTQEMSKSVQQRKQRRQGRRIEDLWCTRRSLHRQDALLNESGDEEGSSVKRTRLAPAEETDAETFNPYRKLYRKRSSQRRSLNSTGAEGSREEEVSEADALWQFLNDGRSAATFTTMISAAPHSYPIPQAEDLLMASSSLPETPETKEGSTLKTSSDDHKSCSVVKSWIQDKTQGQLQQLVYRHSLCGLARALMDPPSG